jgi:alanine-synthesizing transaminase
MESNLSDSTITPLQVPLDGQIRKSHKLDDVCYDIRGPVLKEATRLEEEGHRVLKLNIGNPAPWGFEAPEEILRDVIHNLPMSQGYCESKGLYSARKAVMQYSQQLGVSGVEVDDIYIGNGVSELVVMALQGLLDNGDEVLVPAPDYPLWTAAVNLCGGRAVHYRCDEANDWQPDVEHLRSQITARTRAIVVINPNNPTGAVYSKEVLQEILEVARSRDLVVFADEIYDKIIYGDATHIPMASLADDLLIVTMNGLSKSYRVAGFRSIQDFLVPGGRLYDQREHAYERLTAIDGITCVKPRGALYLFPRLDTDRFNIHNDEQFALDLLKQEKVLVVQGTGFNWPEPDHFRLVFLPHQEDMDEAMDRLERFLHGYRQ